MEQPLIVYTTDFGLSDAYAGVMKGVALTINPNLRFIDLTHQIQPQNISQASFLLGLNHQFLPANAIHVAVVDPGVGTERRPILLTTPCGSFVGPDNGLLSGVISNYLNENSTDDGQIELPPCLSAIHLTNADFWRRPVSETFHGRDVFTPVAAHLSLGPKPKDFGQPINSLNYLRMPQPIIDRPTITGHVIYPDVYGNLITNIPSEILPKSGLTRVTIKDRNINRLSRTFNDNHLLGGDKLIALIGSHGHLEIAVANGNAAELLQASQGEIVTLTSFDD